MTDENIPKFEFDAERMAKIKASLGVDSIIDEPPDGTEKILPTPPVKRRRGRPRKHPVEETGTTVKETAEAAGIPVTPARLNRVAERELSERLQSIFVGGTGLVAGVRPYLQMRDDEAKAIADPLSSYLQRNAETMAIAQQVVENYDLLAIVIGVLTYAVRVYGDRTTELAEHAKSNPPKSTFSERLAEHKESDNNGQAEGYPNRFGTSYVPEPVA